MARQQRKMEGDEDQRRKMARDARRQGKQPSELGATLGASKQRAEAKKGMSHHAKLDLRDEGKQQRSRKPARPGSR
jgi:hypothetical protein